MNEKQNVLQDTFTLEEETVSFGGMMLEYRLLVCDTYADRFRVCVTSGDERSESGLGNHIDSAIRCYRTLVRGRVTPCGLQDVMYDLSKCL